jgi:putative tricarboxylic transport membrane protein
MGDDRDSAQGGERAVATWPVELVVAGLLAGIAVLVMADSWRVGIGWGLEGPQAGFFPFYVGLILLGAAGTTMATNLVATSRARGSFVDREGFGRVLSVLVPTVVFVVAVNWLGIYVAAALLIAFFMRRHGGFALAASLGLGAAIAVLVFVTFEVWFLMPLPKGPLEAALGY